MSRGVSAIRADLSAARERLAKEEDWMAEHGGDLAGYVVCYGAADDPNRAGDGGEAIYAADRVLIERCRQEIKDLGWELDSRAQEVRHAVRCTEWGDRTIEEIAAMMPDLAEVLEAEADGDA